MGRGNIQFRTDKGSLAIKMASAPIKKLEVKDLPNKEFIKNWKESAKKEKNV